MKRTWLDRVTDTVAPGWSLKRQRARLAIETLHRHYEGAATGRRTQGWRTSSGDANAVIGPALTKLREAARDLVRNNPYAESALNTIADDTVGYGIQGKAAKPNQQADAAWRRWADSTYCDADGRHDFYGLQKLIIRTVVESGEVLVRRRFRLPEDGFPIPMQLQVLDPDFLDTARDVESLPNGGRIVQGVEFNVIGQRVAYWLFQEHPGSMQSGLASSVPVPADGVKHIFKSSRPGQVRAPSWFAPVLLRFKDFDEYEDATLMKQKIAACLSVLTTDVDGSGTPLGTSTTEAPDIDSLEPGAILNMAAGRDVKIVAPPSVRDYADYSKTQLRAIATGLGVTYEDLTGDYADMPFSAARMSRLAHQERIHDWRWRILIPQFCDPVWGWVMETAAIAGLVRDPTVKAKWTPPPFAMVDPVSEGLAAARNVRACLTSLSETIREQGYDPDELLAEIASDNKKLDKLGIVTDSDARNVTQAGQLQGKAAAGSKPAEVPQPDAAVARAAAAWPRR